MHSTHSVKWRAPSLPLRVLYHLLRRVSATQQIVGRERRERLSQLAWCGAGCFNSRRRVNSTVGRIAVSERRAVATRSKRTFEWMIPSLPLRVLYHLLRRVSATQQIVGRERLERLSQLAWCCVGCFASRRVRGLEPSLTVGLVPLPCSRAG